MSDPFWRERAACRDADPDMFFDAAHRDAAQAVCARCPVTDECLASRGGCEGMWGGQVFKPEGYKSIPAPFLAPVGHGTAARHQQHLRDGEKPCRACTVAASEARHQRAGEKVRRVS